MLEAGDNELALQLAVAAEKRYDDSDGIRRLEVQAADRLRARSQYIDPFGFVAYSEMIGREHAAIPAGVAPPPVVASAWGE